MANVSAGAPGRLRKEFPHPARLLLWGIVRAYRIILSPLMVALFGPACRFEPSCSAYAEAAIREYGVFGGGYMAARRLLRCRPMGGWGYDPVPARAEQLAQPRLFRLRKKFARSISNQTWKPEF